MPHLLEAWCPASIDQLQHADCRCSALSCSARGPGNGCDQRWLAPQIDSEECRGDLWIVPTSTAMKASLTARMLWPGGPHTDTGDRWFVAANNCSDQTYRVSSAYPPCPLDGSRGSNMIESHQQRSFCAVRTAVEACGPWESFWVSCWPCLGSSPP